MQLTSKTNRELDCYTERHHIIPLCMGGSDDKENLVTLTAREHYIAHLLLTKCSSAEYRGKLLHAYMMMAVVKDKNQERFYKINSRLFESRKIESNKIKSEYRHTEEAKRNISKNLKGIKKPPFTDEHRANISKGHKGQKAWNKGLKGVHKQSEKQKHTIRELFSNTVSCFDKQELINVRIPKEEYYNNKHRYITHSTKEYILNYKEKMHAYSYIRTKRWKYMCFDANTRGISNV
jgi:hypothetical protein